jgi:hypothetical protein
MADSGMSYLYTIGGYATLFGVGYAIYHVSTQKTKKRVSTTQTKVVKTAQAEPRKEDKKKKQRMESFASEIQEAKQAAKATAREKVPSETTTRPSNASARDNSDDVDNREFARQLAKAKEGTTFANKSDGGKQREKSVKQSRANQMAGANEDKTSTPSSTTGADADDDQSPVVSPEAGPVDVSGVADMLEPARAGPSVIRLTDTTEKKQKPKSNKPAEPVETKKQRQNRQKAEAAKAAREEAEKERKALEEKQRRQARVAEGRAAKDGSQFMAAVNGNKSAWKQGAPNGTTAQSEEVLHQPLDTFEQVPSKKQAPSKKQENETNSKPAEGNWASSLPSEEEQLEMLKDEADEWSTVKTKSSKKPAKKSSSVDSGDEPTQSRPSAAVKQPSAPSRH